METPLLALGPLPAPPDAPTLQALSALTACLACDCGAKAGAVGPLVRPLGPDMRLCGPVFTVRTPPGDNLGVNAAIVLAPPGSVLVIATGGAGRTAVVGDVLCGYAVNRGLAGIVTDGFARDLDGILATGLPVFAAGLHPVAPARTGPAELSVPVRIGDVEVGTADVCIADSDGVVFVRRDSIPALLDALPAEHARETAAAARIAAGASENPWLAEVMRTGLRRRP